MNAHRPILFALLNLSVIGATACGGGDPGMDIMPEGVDEAGLLARVAAYQTSGFTKITREPRMSTHMGQMVSVFAADDIADRFRSIDPSDDTLAVGAFPEGAMVIKEQLDATGAVAALTVMAKGTAGYNSDAGDWWFAQTNPQGVVNGNFSGKVGFCIGCHTPQRRTDFLFGVPNDNK